MTAQQLDTQLNGYNERLKGLGKFEVEAANRKYTLSYVSDSSGVKYPIYTAKSRKALNEYLNRQG